MSNGGSAYLLIVGGDPWCFEEVVIFKRCQFTSATIHDYENDNSHVSVSVSSPPSLHRSTGIIAIKLSLLSSFTGGKGRAFLRPPRFITLGVH